MVWLRYTSLIMVLLLLLHGLSICLVHANQGTEESNNALKTSLRKSLKGLHDRVQISSTTATRKSHGSSEGQKGGVEDEAKEIMKLMHKDYGRKWAPKRKPPINNQTPMH